MCPWGSAGKLAAGAKDYLCTLPHFSHCPVIRKLRSCMHSKTFFLSGTDCLLYRDSMEMNPYLAPNNQQRHRTKETSRTTNNPFWHLGFEGTQAFS